MAFTPLNALNAFIAVARRRSYAAAARDLGVSTSALSQSVQQLEERVGVALLTRTSRSVALTDAGQRLMEDAGPGVDQALAAIRNVKDARGEMSGRLRLSVPSVSVSLVLTRLIPKFLERFPKVQVDVRVENNLVDLVRERLDAGIRLIEAIDRDMVHVRLFGACRLIVVGAPSYLDRRGIPQTPADLAHHDCIGFRPSDSDEPWAWEFERGKRTWRVPTRAAVLSNDRELSLELALAGVGLLYGLEPLLALHIAAGRLRVVLPQYAPKVPGLYLYYPSRAQVSPQLRAFVALARELASSPAVG